MYCIYWHVFTTKDVFAVGERIGVCFFTRRLSEGCTADYVQQVVDALLERGFFSKAQYEKNGILTSESIQDHYFEAVQQRKCVEVSTDYLLIEISKYKNLYVDGSNVGISTENVDMKT